MRIITNEELVVVAGGSVSSDDPETTLIEDGEGNISPVIGGGDVGGGSYEPDPDGKDATKQIIEAASELIPKVKGKIEVKIEVKTKSEDGRTEAVGTINVTLEGERGSKAPKKPATKG